MCITNRPPPGSPSEYPPGRGHRSGDPEDGEIDFKRVVWDPDYRRSIIRRLKREANDYDPGEKV
jgi:hypothetical protein